MSLKNWMYYNSEYTVYDCDTSISLKTIRSESYRCRCFIVEASKQMSSKPLKRKYTSINGVLFSADGKTLLCYPPECDDTSYTIPEGTEAINEDAFALSHHLVEVVMPDSVTQIGPGAFCACTNLSRIRMSQNIRCFPDAKKNAGVFEDCCWLRTFNWPEQLEYIGNRAFYNTCLPEINLPPHVRYIGAEAFAISFDNKENLEISCVIPPSVRVIEPDALAGVSIITVLEGSASGLIPACMNTNPYIRSENRYGAVFIKLIQKNGSEILIFLPSSLSIEGKRHIQLAWNCTEFDFDEYDKAFAFIKSAEEKHLVALNRIKNTNQNSIYENYLRHSASRMAAKFIELHNESMLIELIGLNFLTGNALEKLLKLANKAGMTTAAAYLLDSLNRMNNVKSLRL